MPDTDFYGEFGPPAESPSAYAGIFAAARYALTGNSASATPTDETLAYPVEDAVLDLLTDYPCTGSAETMTITLTGGDLRFFNRAAGAALVLSLLNTPQAGDYARTLVKVKIGPVEETVQDGLVIDQARAWLEEERAEALARISCIAEGRIAASLATVPPPLLSGRRRALDARRPSCSPIYNGYLRRY